MKQARRVVLGATLLLLLALAGVGRHQVTRGFPPTGGTLQLAGLDGPVEIRRDGRGVAHVYATTAHDGFFAQGVVHAQDRLWQMEWQRRAAQGRLSEVMGTEAVAADRLARALALGAAAQRDWAALSDEARAALHAYSDGVNAYQAARPTLPLEFRLLGVGWEPWQPTDSLLWLKMVQWEGSHGAADEALRAQLVGRVGPEMAARLLGEAAANDAGEALSLRPEVWSALGEVLRPNSGFSPDAARGSVGWVVAGSRASEGRPLLVGAAQSPPQLPSRWYEIGLHAPGLNVVGASLPGVPAVLVGHNARVAWALAPWPADTQDWVAERLDAAGERYEWQGQWLPLATRQETIAVRGGAAVPIEVRATRHGPLLSDLVGEPLPPVALRWQALAEPSSLLDAILALNRAATRDDFLAALQGWDAPTQTFLYADDSGAIGSVAAGALSARLAGNGALPQAGWTGAAEGSGTVPLRDLPQTWNPADGILVAPDAPAPRAAWLRDRLARGERWTPDDMAALLADVASPTSPPLVAALVAVRSDDIIVQRAQEQLAAWNGQVEGHLPGAALYHVAHAFAVRHLLADELGDGALVEQYLDGSLHHFALVEQLLDEPDHPLWDDRRTPTQEQRDAILRRALLDTTDWLGRRFGDVPHEWFWDRIHRADFRPLLEPSTPLARLMDQSGGSVGGDWTTINTVGFSYADDFRVTTVPGYRQVIEVGAWEDAQSRLAGGQSGQLFHSHFADQLGPWREGTLDPLGWIGAEREGLRLEP